jgi:TonB family protein
MSSLSIPLPRQISDNQFIGDLMSLLQRRSVKCGDPQSFESFAYELVSNAALRSDLFTLCVAISHMAAEDRTGEELLALVARALRGPAVAKGAAPDEIPPAMRSGFLEGYAAWCNRTVAAMDKPLPRTAGKNRSAEDWSPPTDQRRAEPVMLEGSAVGERSIQMALNIVRERSPNGVLAFPLSGSGRSFDGDRIAPFHVEPLYARGGVSIRIGSGAVLAIAGFLAIATSLGGAYVYHSLHPTLLKPSVALKPVANEIAKTSAGISAASPVPQAAHATPAASVSAPSHPRKVAAPAAASKAGAPIRKQPVIVLSAPGNREALVGSAPDASAASGASAVQAGATVEVHRVSPVYVPSTTMDELALAEPRPVYPADLPKGISGTVMLEVSISKRGNVTSAKAVSGPVELRRAAEQALKEWRFRPYLVAGDPAEVTTTVGFFFNGR